MAQRGRRSSNGTKTNSQYEARLTEVWRLWNRGQRQWQIAQALDITDRQVRYDLKTLENRWRAETSKGMAAHMEAELARLNELELTYWNSWEKSCTEKQTTSTEQSEGDGGAKRRAALKKESRDGNPAFLAGVERCIERRCKILGIDAPIKIKDVTEMTDEELFFIAATGKGIEGRKDNLQVDLN